MSMRSVVEFNHDCIYDLHKDGHISDELYSWLQAAHSHRQYDPFLPVRAGIRYLCLRHHTDETTLEID